MIRAGKCTYSPLSPDAGKRDDGMPLRSSILYFDYIMQPEKGTEERPWQRKPERLQEPADQRT